MCIFMPPFFPHLFVSAYQTDRHTVTRLIQEQHSGARICSQKWHPPLLLLFSFSNQSNPDSQRYTATRRSRLRPRVCELGYRDDRLAGETGEQTIARVCITTPADSRVTETQGSFVPSEGETLSWRSRNAPKSSTRSPGEDSSLNHCNIYKRRWSSTYLAVLVGRRVFSDVFKGGEI